LTVCQKIQLHYRGGQLEIQFDSSTTVVSQLNPQGPVMQLRLSNGEMKLLLPNKPVEISTLHSLISLSLSLSFNGRESALQTFIFLQELKAFK
jgi:hypothetical protein